MVFDDKSCQLPPFFYFFLKLYTNNVLSDTIPKDTKGKNNSNSIRIKKYKMEKGENK